MLSEDVIEPGEICYKDCNLENISRGYLAGKSVHCCCSEHIYDKRTCEICAGGEYEYLNGKTCHPITF